LDFRLVNSNQAKTPRRRPAGSAKRGFMVSALAAVNCKTRWNSAKMFNLDVV